MLSLQKAYGKILFKKEKNILIERTVEFYFWYRLFKHNQLFTLVNEPVWHKTYVELKKLQLFHSFSYYVV